MNYNISSNSSNISSVMDGYAGLPDLLTSLGIMCIVFAVWITLANGLLITTIMSSATLRTQLRNQLIVNICIVDLLQGLIVCPIYAHRLIGQALFHSCELATFLYFGFVHADTFLIMWLFVTQDLLYLSKQLRLDLPLLSKRGLILARIFWNGLPWFLLFVVLIPIVISGFEESSTDLCQVYKYNNTVIHASTLDFFLPAVVVLALVVCLVVFHTCAKPQVRVAEESLLDEPDVLEHPVCYIVPSLVVVSFNFMDQFFLLFVTVTTATDLNLDLILPLAVSGSVLELARCGVLPLTWLLLPDVRSAVKDFWNSLVRRARNDKTEIQTMSYKKEEESP